MNVVVPLAGPDFIGPNGTPKSLTVVGGEPLMRRVLASRPWSDDAPQYTFVLHDDEPSRRFASEQLAAWYPQGNTVFLSTYAAGAALSAAAGVALSTDQPGPLIVDLADIEFRGPRIALERQFSASVGGLGFVFESDKPEYSYLRTDSSGRFVEAAEKRVISTHASAGVYVFRDPAVYLNALAISLADPGDHTHNGLHFVCPLFNGVARSGLTVQLAPVELTLDVKFLKPSQ